ncbi:obscurin isoform X2 [Eucyclogobius newberryi]|uniref:obscurin isoform X2 n=1 Tax=Eucyclogobius newberryi TaxID=166745 RepID=UPI003B59E7F8
MDVFGGAPRFLAYPRPVMVQSGTDAVLKCQIGGDPRPAVIWERNNEKIDPQERYRVFEDGNVYNLIIPSVTVEDSGQYICKAKNSIGETYAAATLKVEGEAQEMELREENKPRFLIKPLSTRAGRGEDAVFSCKVWGKPKPDVIWEKDGKKLNDIFESTHFSVGSQDGGWFQLKIFKTRAPDGGVYTCKARNEFGEALAGAVLLVDAGPGHDDEANRNGYTNGQWKSAPGRNGRPAPNRLNNDAMTKTAKVKMFAVTEGKHAKFRCFVTGKPKPEIIWRKDGRLILSGRRYLLYEDREGYFTLKVLYCKQKDNGVYVCAASNTAGQTLSAVHLSVKEPPVRFKQPLIDLEVWERDLAVLECEVPEDSVPITWYLEDRRLQPGDKYGMEQWGTKRRLTIRDIGVDDDGIYLCEMPDGGRSIAEVAVKGTIVRKLPRKVDVLEGENAAFCVEVEEEEMDIHWYKDGVELRETHQTILKSFGRTHILVFVNTMPPDTGQVMFFVGRSKTSSQLRVKAARHCPPSAPVGVQINTERANAALLSWIPAQDSRKNPPSGYVLERQEVGTGSQEWLQCLTTDSATSVEILGDSVPCEADYRFRICSVNKYGKSNNVEFPRTVHLVPVARIQVPLQDAMVPEGQDALFSMELTASVIGTWFLSGTQIQEDERFSTRRTRTHQSLRIRGVRDSDNGAEITFIAYGIRDSAALYIQAPLVKFLPLSEMDRNKFVETGIPIVLYCELSDPAAPVHWYKNGAELQTTDGLHIQSEGTMRRIVIQSAEFSHSGVYCCDAIDDVIRFNVEVEAPPVRFSAVPEAERNKRVHCGRPLLLQCEVSEPSAPVTWHKDGSKLAPQSGLEVLSEARVRSLLVHSAELYHTGLYSCKSKGDAATFNVDVTAPAVVFEPVAEEGRALSVSVGHALELQCSVSDPEALVRWFHDDTELGPHSGFQIRAEGGGRTLCVQSAEMCHSGVYTCSTGDDSVEFTVDVQAIPALTVFERMRSLEAVTPLELECEVPDSALSICWFKDDEQQLLPKQNQIWDEQENRERQIMVVQSSESLHSALNRHETKDDTVHVTVHHEASSLPPSPGVLEMVEDSCSMETGTKLDGAVQASAQLRHKESRSEAESEAAFVKRGLVIKPTQPSNSGSYCCATADDVAQLVVKVEKTSPIAGPSSIVQQFEISDPVAKACWYKDGTPIGNEQGQLQDINNQSCHGESQSPRQDWDPGQSFSPGQDRDPGQSFSPGQDRDPGQSFSPGQDRDPGQSFSPGQDRDPRQSFSPGQDRDPGKSFSPGQDRDPGQSFSPGQDRDPGQSFSPGQDRDPGKSFSPGQDRDPRQSFSPGQDRDPGKSFSPGQDRDPGKSFSPGQDRDAGQSFSCGQTYDPGQSFSPGQDRDPGQSFSSGQDRDPGQSFSSGENRDPGQPFSPGESHSTRLSRIPVELHSPGKVHGLVKSRSSGQLLSPVQTFCSSAHGTEVFEATNLNDKEQGHIPDNESVEFAPNTEDDKAPVRLTAVGDTHRSCDAGEDVDLICEVSNPKEPVSWFRDGARVCDGAALKILSHHSNRQLSIASAAPGQSGVYSCHTADHSVQFHVDVKAPLLRFSALPEAEQRMSVLQGCPLALRCELSDASGQVTWYKDGAELLPESGVDIQSEGQRRSVFVPSAERQHCGVYRCESKDDDVQFTVDIRDSAVKAVMFLELPDTDRKQQVLEGSPVVLQCELSQVSSAEITWSKDGEKVHPDTNTNIHQEGLVHTLKIHSAERQHSGVYECSTNQDKIQFEVDVKGRAAHILPLALSDKHKLACVGAPIVLQCQVSEAAAQVTWAKDHMELFCRTGLDMKRDGCLRKLMVHCAKLCDAGTYSCSLAHDVVTFSVRVQAPPVTFREIPEEDLLRTAVEQEELVLSCEVSAPEGAVQWYKDGAEVQPSDALDVRAEGTARSLTVRSARLSDTGTFSCRTGDNVVMFKVTVREPPVTIVYPKEDVHLDRHVPEEVILSCELSRANGVVSWFKDGQKLQESENIKLKVEGPYRRLKILSSRVEDSGEYVCDSDHDSIFFQLSITEPPVRIVSPSQSQMELCQQTSERMVLSCEISRPNAVVRWYRDGLQVEESQNLLIEEDGVYRRLIIPKTTIQDSAEYVCDTADDSMTFFVNIAEPPVRFVRPRKSASKVETEVGKAVVLDCEVSRPNAEVTWKRNGDEVEDMKNVSILEEGVLRQLTIHALAEEDAGQYVCDAKDDLMDFTVTVKEPPVRIVGKPEGRTEKAFCVADDIILVCEMSRANADVTWSKDGRPLEESERYCTEEQGVFRSLVVLNAALEDSGEYGCSAGDDSMVFHITVREPPVQIVGNSGTPEHHLLLRGEDLVLECEVSRPDAEVRWLRNGEELGPDERVTIQSCHVVRKFVLMNLQPSDSGEFTCDAADDRMVTVVEVQEPPVSFTNKPSQPTSLAAFEGESVTLSAELTRELDRGQAVRWLKDGRLLDAENIHISSSGAEQRLTLSPLQMSDSGVYACDAMTDQMTFNLLVREMKVQFVRPLQSAVALRGHSLTLLCEVNKAKGDVQWLKDGLEVAPSRRFTVRALGRERSFTVHEVSDEDAGEFSCASTDDRTTATVTVQAPRVVEFIAGLRNVTLREGEDAVFKCVVSPEDVALVWQINGRAPSSQRATATRNGTCHTLRLCQCGVCDSGTVSANAEGQVSSAELQVQEPQVVFTRHMSAVTAEELGEALLEVEVSQDSGEVQWMRQGVLLHAGPKYSLLKQGHAHSLRVHQLHLSDSGRFSCETLHDRTQAQLTVTPRKISITKGLSDLRTTERETASFEVHVSHPDLVGTWFRNGTRLKPNAHFRMSSTHMVHSLTISHLSVDDTGSFMFCVDQLKTTARLVVREPPVSVLKKLEDQKFPEGAVISIECELSRHNVDIKWMKNGVEVKPSKELRIYAMGRKRFLQVLKCRLSDSGVYTCDAGDASTSCSVEVYEPELLVVQELEDLEIEEDQNAIFMCEVSVEEVQGEWYKKNQKIQNTSSIKTRQEGSKHFLLMCNVRPEDSGEIKFVARHVQSVAFLDVEELPVSIVKPLQDTTAMEKTRVLLDCTVSNPRCSCRWYRGCSVILPSERFEICSEGCTRKLIIQQVALEDEGTYSVQVGEHSCSARLSVEAQSVSLVRGLSDLQVVAPDDARFEVEVSVPLQMSPVWTLKGVALRPGPGVLMEKMGTLHRLTLRQTTAETSGDVEFVSGKTRSRARLAVVDPE